MDAFHKEGLLGGLYDAGDAFLCIHASMGGVSAEEWAEMLLHTYTGWAERRNFSTSVIYKDKGDEAGIKSATIALRGSYAYGLARGETGVHRLVRLSLSSGESRREIAFALVKVLPLVDDVPELEIKSEDIRTETLQIDGQTAVQMTYREGTPEQVVVVSQIEGSVPQSEATAHRLLRGRLLTRELRGQREAAAKLRGEAYQVDADTQIRTYQLHPETLVRDHRTDYTTSDVNDVLDGALDLFMEAYLRWNVGRDTA
ncbi:MAG: PCRF domain-containing protein [Chloroflexota bacterium]